MESISFSDIAIVSCGTLIIAYRKVGVIYG